SRSGAPTGAATDTTTNLTTNNGNNRQVAAGTYYYRFTFVDSTGVESNPSDVVGPRAVAAGTGGQGQAIKLSNLPQRSAGVRLNIYRTKANGSSYFLVGNYSGADNAKGEFLDGMGDAGLKTELGVQAALDVGASGMSAKVSSPGTNGALTP